MADCACRGANPNCFRCGGSGYTGRIVDPVRTTAEGIGAELKGIAQRASTRTSLACPHCGVAVRRVRLADHIRERCPKTRQPDLNSAAVTAPRKVVTRAPHAESTRDAG